MRRGIGFTRRMGFRGYPPMPWTPSAPLITLDLFTGGTFARTTEAAYFVASPNAGTAPFLAWAPAGTRRIENRGDGPDMLLMEPSRTNLIIRSRDMSTWSALGTPVRTGGQTQIDGGTAGYLVSCLSGVDAVFRGVASLAVSSGYTHSYWGRADVAGDAIVHRTSSPDLGFGTLSGGTTWERRDQTFIANAASANVFALDARALPGFAAGDRRAHVDLAQLELGYWPTSPIRTDAATVTRSLESLFYSVGNWPAEFLTNGFRFVCAPDFSSADLFAVPASTLTSFVLGFTTGTPGVSFRRDSGTNYSLRLVGASGSVVITNPTWSRGQMLTVTCQNLGGGQWSITLAGATTGNTTAVGTVTMPAAGTLAVGVNTSSANGFFGRISRYIVAL